MTLKELLIKLSKVFNHFTYLIRKGLNEMEEDTFLRRFLIVTWVVVSSLIALLILGATMYFKVTNPTAPIPEVLSNWGGIILGFYFGSFTTFAKDFIFRSRNYPSRPNRENAEPLSHEQPVGK